MIRRFVLLSAFTLFGLASGGDTLAQNATPTVTISLDKTSFKEEDASSGACVPSETITVTATLSASRTEDTTLTVSLGGTATRGADYFTYFHGGEEATKQITISSGATEATAKLQLCIVNDDGDEEDETIIVTSTTTGLLVNSATITKSLRLTNLVGQVYMLVTLSKDMIYFRDRRLGEVDGFLGAWLGTALGECHRLQHLFELSIVSASLDELFEAQGQSGLFLAGLVDVGFESVGQHEIPNWTAAGI